MAYKIFDCAKCGRRCQVMRPGDDPIEDTECLDCQCGETYLPEESDEESPEDGS